MNERNERRIALGIEIIKVLVDLIKALGIKITVKPAKAVIAKLRRDKRSDVC